MTNKRRQFGIQFKKEAIEYYETHKELTHDQCAKKLGIGDSTLARWKREYIANNEVIQFRGSGNYSSESEKENARLKRELKNTQDALDILKKAIGILGETQK